MNHRGLADACLKLNKLPAPDLSKIQAFQDNYWSVFWQCCVPQFKNRLFVYLRVSGY